MQKYCTPEFVFKKVNTWPNYITYLIAFGAFIPAFLVFTSDRHARFGYGGKPLIIVLTFAFILGVLNGLSKTVTIYFDQNSMYVKKGNGTFKRILNRDIVGFYSYNYEYTKITTSVKFVFKDGRTLILQEAGFAEGKDPEKALMLKSFLRTAQRRLDFTLIRKDRWRAFFILGPYLYGPSPSDREEQVDRSNERA
jgi:hypothetical protein